MLVFAKTRRSSCCAIVVCNELQRVGVCDFFMKELRRRLFAMRRESSHRKSLNRSDFLSGFHNTDMPASRWRTKQRGVHSKPEVRDETYVRFEEMAGDDCAVCRISDGSCACGFCCGVRPQ